MARSGVVVGVDAANSSTTGDRGQNAQVLFGVTIDVRSMVIYSVSGGLRTMSSDLCRVCAYPAQVTCSVADGSHLPLG